MPSDDCVKISRALNLWVKKYEVNCNRGFEGNREAKFGVEALFDRRWSESLFATKFWEDVPYKIRSKCAKFKVRSYLGKKLKGDEVGGGPKSWHWIVRFLDPGS